MKKICLAVGMLTVALLLKAWSDPYSMNTKSGHTVNQIEDTTVKKVALTYDDGPNELYTMQLLEVLKKEDVRATFFLLGKAAGQNPDLVKQIRNQGHLIGNHTYDHVDVSTMSLTDATEQIERTNQIIYDCTGEYPYLFRPPFGEISQRLERDCNMLVVLWDVDPRDWRCQDTDAIVRHILKHVEENDVILMHDAYPETVAATEKIIPLLQEQGYQFVTMDELLFE